MIDPLNAKFLQFVTDVEKVNQINKNLHRVVCYELRADRSLDLFITKEANWIAVPILDPFYSIASTLLKHLKVVMLESGQDLFIVTLPNYGLSSFTYNVPLTDEAFKEIEILSPFIAVLFSGTPDSTWFFLSIETDYFILIGSSEFVINLLECKIEERFSQFYAQFINDEEKSDPLLKSYPNFIYDQLRKYNDADARVKFSLAPLFHA